MATEAANGLAESIGRDSIIVPATRTKETAGAAGPHDATTAASDFINAMGVGRFTAMLLLIYGFNNTVG